MGKCDKLLEKAKRNPAGLKFRELCGLAVCHGWEEDRQKGSHVVYKHPTARRAISFQDDKGMAKEYQVRQLLTAIEEGATNE